MRRCYWRFSRANLKLMENSMSAITLWLVLLRLNTLLMLTVLMTLSLNLLPASFKHSKMVKVPTPIWAATSLPPSRI